MRRSADRRLRVGRERGSFTRALPWVALAWLTWPGPAVADVYLGVLADARNTAPPGGPVEPNLVEAFDTLPSTIYGNAVARIPSDGPSDASVGEFESAGPPWDLTCCVEVGLADAIASGAVDGPEGWLRVGTSAHLPAGASGSSIATARGNLTDSLGFAGSDVSFDVDLDFSFASSAPSNVGVVELLVRLAGSELIYIEANRPTDSWSVRFQGVYLEQDVPIPPSYRHSFVFTPPAPPASLLVQLDGQAGCTGGAAVCDSVADATATAYLGITGTYTSGNGYLYLGPLDGGGPGDPLSEAAAGLLFLGVATAMARARAWRLDRAARALRIPTRRGSAPSLR